ncbi:MAG: hypothetical protein ACD_25C00073G0006 [uncultured bacterium]|nr:MAG: hypothetical protein ACD_25C00073G0006 [uncultured bacterium]
MDVGHVVLLVIALKRVAAKLTTPNIGVPVISVLHQAVNLVEVQHTAKSPAECSPTTTETTSRTEAVKPGQTQHPRVQYTKATL